MRTIDYVVRDVSGSVQSGTFPAGDPATIYVSYSKDVSLNLNAADIATYQKHGSDLLLTLSDGQVLILSGYFDEGNTGDKNLFLSEEGELVAVTLEDGQSGFLSASYSGLDVAGKWSSYDDLLFLDLGRVEPVVAPLVAPVLGNLGGLLAGGAAVAGAAVVTGGGGGGGGGGGSTVITPTVDDPTATHALGGTGPTSVTITGTGAPDSTVAVNVGGNIQNVTVAPDGTWRAVFNPADLPADGVYSTTVAVVDPGGNSFDLSGPTVDIDTTPPAVAVTAGAQSNGDLVNAAAQAAGTVIRGTGEAGATITVEIQGTTHTTTVAGDGSWSVTFAPAEIRTGEYNSEIKVTATDTRGNSTSTTETLVVDTVAPVATLATVEGDNVVNAAEASDGVTLTGTGEAGATLSVQFQGLTRDVTVAADGTWSVPFTAAEIRSGTYEADVVLTITDTAGNSSSLTQTLSIDTEQNLTLNAQVGGDYAINAAEQAAGVTFSGTAQPGSSVAVTLGTVTHTVTAAADGSWNASFASSEIPTGTYATTVTAVATDAAGNVETSSQSVQVDTETAVAITPGYAGGDATINAAEAASNVTFEGTAEAGSTVVVTVNGVSRDAVVDASGNWTATFAPGSLPLGEYDTTIIATSTDAVGNSASSTANIRIDTTAGTVAISPAPIEIDDVINAVERADGVTVNGTATPGETVTVTLGTASVDVVASPAGVWSANFTAAQVPTGTDTLPITATITDAAGNTASATESVRLDTSVDTFAQSTAPVEGDDIVNAVERADGVVLNGTVEPGSTVVVQLGSATVNATVDAAGNWTANFPASSIPTGTYDAAVVVRATDPAGNTDTLTDSVRVDTENVVTAASNQTTDDVINAVERQAGVTMTGTAEPGSTVVVNLLGTARTATVDAAGNWSATFTAAEIPTGTYTATASITATDAAGNVTTVSESFGVDTEVANPGVDAVTFIGSDVGRISTQDATDNYQVSTLEARGTVGTPASTTSVDPVFGTELTFTTPIPDGTNLVVSRTDAAQNTSSTLLVLEDNATSFAHAGLGSFDIESLNLEYSADSNLTLTEAQIKAMSNASDTLTIHGGMDDTLTVSGAVNTGATQTIDGNTYSVYTLGTDGTTLVIDQDINVII